MTGALKHSGGRSAGQSMVKAINIVLGADLAEKLKSAIRK
jgi:hypothetical protein